MPEREAGMLAKRDLPGLCCPDFDCLCASWDGRRCRWCGANCRKCELSPRRKGAESEPPMHGRRRGGCEAGRGEARKTSPLPAERGAHPASAGKRKPGRGEGEKGSPGKAPLPDLQHAGILPGVRG
jgi:hypothetical protein